MRLIGLPGVFAPLSDSRLLAAHVRAASGPGVRMLDACTGSGIIAISAAVAGAEVTATDVSRRAVFAVRLNARLNGTRVRALHGDLLGPVRGERFDLVASNPPYVPDDEPERRVRGLERAWRAGDDGRAILDRLCDEAPGVLSPGGSLLLVHSSVCGEDATLRRLADRGLAATVIDRRRGALGPLLHAQAARLERRGLLAEGKREEELIVVRATAPTAGKRPGVHTPLDPTAPAVSAPGR